MSIGNGNSSQEVAKTIDFLKDYVVVHFNTEEQLMLQYHYVDYPYHKEQHLYFIEQVNKIEQNYRNKGGRLYLTLKIQEELVDWLINHIAKLDTELALFLKEG